MNELDGYVVIAGWAMDMVRAVNSRPKLFQLLFRLSVGRYGWNEYVGLWNALKREGHNPEWPYDLQNVEYHKTNAKRIMGE